MPFDVVDGAGLSQMCHLTYHSGPFASGQDHWGTLIVAVTGYAVAIAVNVTLVLTITIKTRTRLFQLALDMYFSYDGYSHQHGYYYYYYYYYYSIPARPVYPSRLKVSAAIYQPALSR